MSQQQREDLEAWMKTLGFELIAPYGETRKSVFFNEKIQLAFGVPAAEFFYPLLSRTRTDAIEQCQARPLMTESAEAEARYGYSEHDIDVRNQLRAELNTEFEQLKEAK